MDDIDEEVAVMPVKEQFRPSYPKKVMEEGTITKLGLKKKLVRVGEGWDNPETGDEITVEYSVAVVGDGVPVASSEKDGEPLVVRVGHDGIPVLTRDLSVENILKLCEEGLTSMKKGEVALYTIPREVSADACKFVTGIPHDATLELQVELISWLKIIDICGDGGVLKKIIQKSEKIDRAKESDEVTVKYEVKLEDGKLVAKSPEDGVEFLVSKGHFCPAIGKTVTTMRKGEKAILRVEPQYAFGESGRPAQHGFVAIPPNAVISISIELIGYKLLEYVTEDKKVIKKITNPIEKFEKPNSGAVVQVRYVAKLANGTVFDIKGYNGEEPFEFLVDEDQVITGLDLAVATMKYGETAIVIIHPDYGFGEKETTTDLTIVPASSILYYDIEMVSFRKVKESWDMKPEERIDHATKRKQEGNAYFKAGNFKRAALRYDMAVKYVEFDSTFSDEQKVQGKILRISSILNKAACQIKLKEFREAISLCSKVLKSEKDNIKALYRRAQAYTDTNDLDLAKLDLVKALELEPANWEVKSLLARVNSLQAYYDKKESKLFSNMIERLGSPQTNKLLKTNNRTGFV